MIAALCSAQRAAIMSVDFKALQDTHLLHFFDNRDPWKQR